MIIPTFPLQFSHPTRTKYTCPKLLKTDISFHQAKFHSKHSINRLSTPVWGAELGPHRSAGAVSGWGEQGSPSCYARAPGCRTSLGCVGLGACSTWAQ